MVLAKPVNKCDRSRVFRGNNSASVFDLSYIYIYIYGSDLKSVILLHTHIY